MQVKGLPRLKLEVPLEKPPQGIRAGAALSRVTADVSNVLSLQRQLSSGARTVIVRVHTLLCQN